MTRLSQARIQNELNYRTREAMTESSKERNAPEGAKPRTWTLPPTIACKDAIFGPRDFNVPVPVIELEPVLDLLERLSMDVGMQESFQKCWTDGTLGRTRTLLREHGRKTEDWELDEE